MRKVQGQEVKKVNWKKTDRSNVKWQKVKADESRNCPKIAVAEIERRSSELDYLRSNPNVIYEVKTKLMEIKNIAFKLKIHSFAIILTHAFAS